MNGRIEKDMPNETYHALDGVSKSGLDKIERSPAHFKWPKPHKPTRNMEIGTAIHAAILEPERFDKEYVVAESDARNVKAYKDLMKEHGSELTLTMPESVKVNGMRESVHNDVESMQYLTMPGDAEISFICTDPETGIQIRSRFDWLTHSRVSVDVKKTQDLRKFARSVSDYRYHVQDAMYSFVYKQVMQERLEHFFFLAVEEESPYSCKLFELDDLAKEIGQHYFRKNLRTYADCVNSGKWPHKDLPEIIELSNWEVSNYENDLEVFI